MWYKNIAGMSFGLVTKHACDGQTDGQNHDSQDRASIARAIKTRTVQPVATCRHSPSPCPAGTRVQALQGRQSRDAPIGLLR